MQGNVRFNKRKQCKSARTLARTARTSATSLSAMRCSADFRLLLCRQKHKPSTGLDFELPYNSKLLLLAAYIASRNKPGSDRRLFNTERGKKRRKNAFASDRQVCPNSVIASSGYTVTC